MNGPSTLERAFTLARSGECANLNDIRAKLKSENHDQVDAHLAGPSIKRQLTKLCEANRVDVPDETASPAEPM
jgi:hypothetical protein